MHDSQTHSSDQPQPLETQPEGEASDARPVPKPWSIALPHITTAIPTKQVFKMVERKAYKGKLAGYARTGVGFYVDAFGTLYDRTLQAKVSSVSEGSELHFTATLNKKFPALVIVSVLFTIWPGVYFTDSLLSTWFYWYTLSIWLTAAWYVPLTVLSVPVLLKHYRKSELASWIHAHEVIDELSETLEGEVHPVEY